MRLRIASGFFGAALALALLTGTSAARPGQAVGSYGAGGSARLPADTRVLGAVAQPDGKLVVVGEQGQDAGNAHMLVTRLTTTGKQDPKFHGGHPYVGPAGTLAHAVAVQSDGKLIIAGAGTDPAGTEPHEMLVLRLKSNGSPDRTFSGNGFAEALSGRSGQGLGVALQKDGKIVVGGSATLGSTTDFYPRITAARFNKNGSLDGSFGQGGTAVFAQGLPFSVANDVAIQSNGRIVLAGSHRGNLQSTDTEVARLTSRGAPDPSFSGDGFFQQQLAEGAAFSSAYGVELAPGGKVVIGGTAASGSTGPTALAARLTSGGALDPSFGGDGTVLIPATASSSAYGDQPVPGARALALSGGDVILAGHFDQFSLREATVWALRGNGSLDSRFGSGGRTVFSTFPGLGNAGSSQFDALAAAPDGSLLAAGNGADFLAPAFGLVAKLSGFPVPLRLTVKVDHTFDLSRALARGIPVTFTCNQACTLSAVLKALGSTVARASGKAGSTKTLRLRFSAAGRRKLAGKQRVAATLITTAKAGGKTKKVTKRIVLKD